MVAIRPLVLVVLAVAAVAGTALAVAPPPEWQARIDQAEMLFSHEEPSDKELMPMIGNGYIGHAIGSNAIFSTGLYVGLRHLWQYYINSDRARIPSTSCAAVVGVEACRERGLAVTEVGIAVDYARAVVYRRWIVDAAVVEFRWYCHQSRKAILVVEIDVDNSAGSASLDIPVHAPYVFESEDIGFKKVAGAAGTRAANASVYAGKVLRKENPYTHEILQDVAVVYDGLPSLLHVEAGGTFSRTFLTAVRTSVDSENPTADVQADFDSAHTTASNTDGSKNTNNNKSSSNNNNNSECGSLLTCTSLLDEHVAAWEVIWEARMEVGGNAVLGAQINASMYA
eukprot:Opistho-2@86042